MRIHVPARLQHDLTTEAFSRIDIIRQNNLRLPRVAHLAELLIKERMLSTDSLPLTIGQARKMIIVLCST